MKFISLQQDLLKAIQSVSRSIGIKNTLPVLANILIQTEPGKLKLSATNLEIGVIKKLNSKIEEDGELTVPAKTLLEIISSLPQEEIVFESSQETLKITTKSFSGTVNGITASEFPSIPLSQEKGITISSDILLKSIPQINFAAAVDEGRPTLTGILTNISGSTLEFVATDGFRLAHKKITLDKPQELAFKSLIPRRTFEEVVRLISEDLKEEGDTIEISTSENQNQIIFKIGTTEVSSRLIEGKFPLWENIVPSKFENKTLVDRQELVKSLKLATVFAKSEANIIKIETQDNKLKISSQAKELGAQESEIEAQTEGTPINIAFNSKFLIEALNGSNASQVSIEFSGNLSPALIKPIGIEGLEYVVMPIRLS